MSVHQINPADTRLVYGVRCTWWDGIHAIATREGLPCCPHCRNVLFEMDSEEQFMAGAHRYEADGHPGYVAMLTWGRGRCFQNMAALERAYAERTDG
jgi:hypothetical protein